MTLDSSNTPESSSAESAQTPAKKAPRRRVTRQAAPAGDATTSQAETKQTETKADAKQTDTAATSAADAPKATPVKKTGARRARTTSTVSTAPASLTDVPVTAPTTTVAAPAATLDVLSELASPTAGSDDAPKAPRRRRATTGGPVRAASASITAPADAATTTAPEAPVTVPAADETTPAPRTARRSRSRAVAEKVANDHEAEVATLDVVASIEAMTGSAAEPAARPATKSRRSRSASKPAGPAVGAEQTDETPAAPAAPAVEEEAAPAPRTRSTGRARATRAAKAETAAPAAAEAPAPAVEPATAAEEPRKTRSRSARGARSAAPVVSEPVEAVTEVVTETVVDEPVVETPSAATTRSRTALLFQAPDPAAAAPRRRRAQSPAGPPKAIFAATGDTEDTDQLDEDAAEDLAVVDTDVIVDEVVVDEDAVEDGRSEDSDEDHDTDANGAPRRRRRRGGRGRRNRGGSDNQRDEYYDADDAERSESGDASESTDEESEEQAEDAAPSRSRRRSRSGGGAVAAQAESEDSAEDESEGSDHDSDESDDASSSRRRRRRRRGTRGGEAETSASTTTQTRTRAPRVASDEVTALKGSTRLEAKRQRRREGRDAGRRRSIITEAEFLARREAVERSMIVRERGGRTQIAVLEDGVLVEHYVSQQSQASMAGNVYLGRVQNVLPSMEAAFVDVGKGRNAVLYAGEVNWDAVGLEGQPRRIEQALKSGDSVLVQVTKDPIGQKGARLTSQVTLAGRYLVYVPGGGMTGISRKLPDNERARLKKILREVVPETAGVIVRTAAEGASEAELRADIARLQAQWEAIEKKAKTASAPALLQGEPDLAIRVVRDIFNDDFTSLTVSGNNAWSEISQYVNELAPDLAERVTHWVSEKDVFAEARIDEQLAKGLDRKVWLPSGGSLVIDRTEAMTVVDVNTGKFTGSGGTLEETVTRNNLEAAEEIVRQLRLRDIGGIIVIDFIDMVLESNRDLVLRRLVECLGRDRTKHQVAEVTSLGLVQMTRKRVGQGLVEAFSETCDHCNGRGFIVHDEPNEKHFQGGSAPSNAQLSAHGGPAHGASDHDDSADAKRSRRKRGGAKEAEAPAVTVPVLPAASDAVKATLATIAAAAAHAHEHEHDAARQGTPADAEVVGAEVLDVVDVVGADEVAVMPEITEVTEVVELVEVSDAVEPAAEVAEAAEVAPVVAEVEKVEKVAEERPAAAKRPARTSRRATRPAPTRAVLDVFAEVEASREASGNGDASEPQK